MQDYTPLGKYREEKSKPKILDKYCLHDKHPQLR